MADTTNNGGCGRLKLTLHSFTVELIGGKRFEVDHPGALVVRDGVAVFISPGGIPVLFDHESVTQFEAELRKKRKT